MHYISTKGNFFYHQIISDFIRRHLTQKSDNPCLSSNFYAYFSMHISLNSHTIQCLISKNNLERNSIKWCLWWCKKHYLLIFFLRRSYIINQAVNLKYNETSPENSTYQNSTYRNYNGTQVNITEERYFLRKELINKTEFERPLMKSSVLSILIQKIVFQHEGDEILAILLAIMQITVDVSIFWKCNTIFTMHVLNM